MKDIFESDDRSIFIERPGVEEACLPDVLEPRASNAGLFASTWSWRSCVPREVQADVAICRPCCCGWRDKNRQRRLTLRSAL